MKKQEVHSGTGHSVIRLFSNRYLKVSEFCCNGHCTPSGSEEYSRTFDIVLPRNGLFIRQIGKTSHVSDVNHILFFNRFEPYRIKHPVEGGDDSTVISLSERLMTNYIASIQPARRDSQASQFPISFCRTSVAIDFMHRSLINHLLMPDVDLVAVEEIVYAICNMSLQTALKCYKPGISAVRGSTLKDHFNKVEHTKVILQKSFREKLTLGEIAYQAASSPFHLCRIFKVITGISIHGYLNRLRLRASLEPLFDIGDNLTQLALDHGFSSHSHFSHAFKTEYGCSPSQFRASARV